MIDTPANFQSESNLKGGFFTEKLACAREFVKTGAWRPVASLAPA
jgi:hypothetical protein